jgi:hypothetical protein
MRQCMKPSALAKVACGTRITRRAPLSAPLSPYYSARTTQPAILSPHNENRVEFIESFAPILSTDCVPTGLGRSSFEHQRAECHSRMVDGGGSGLAAAH